MGRRAIFPSDEGYDITSKPLNKFINFSQHANPYPLCTSPWLTNRGCLHISTKGGGMRWRGRRRRKEVWLVVLTPKTQRNTCQRQLMAACAALPPIVMRWVLNKKLEEAMIGTIYKVSSTNLFPTIRLVSVWFGWALHSTRLNSVAVFNKNLHAKFA